MTQPRRTLVADEERAIHRSLNCCLRKAGFEPVLAVDVGEAIELAEGDFACAPVDLEMPEVDGLGGLDRFKRHLPEVPVVITSAVGRLKDAFGAMKAGAVNHAAEPFDLEKEMALIESAVRVGRVLEETRRLRKPPPTGAGCRSIRDDGGNREVVETPSASTARLHSPTAFSRPVFANCIRRSPKTSLKPPPAALPHGPRRALPDLPRHVQDANPPAALPPGVTP